ncbi:MAG: hypothetical protein Kow00121_55100 [Elainellaceae cyanobacterium]
MAPAKDPAKDRLSRVVKFAQTEADQQLWQAIEKAIEQKTYGSFSDLCKHALQQLLFAEAAPSSPQPHPAPKPSNPEPSNPEPPSPELLQLRQQMQALQLQVARLSGAIGMKQTLSLSKLEQQSARLEQQMHEQIGQLIDRLNDLETRLLAQPVSVTPLEPTPLEPSAEPDPLLARLGPLLEDF